MCIDCNGIDIDVSSVVPRHSAGDTARPIRANIENPRMLQSPHGRQLLQQDARTGGKGTGTSQPTWWGVSRGHVDLEGQDPSGSSSGSRLCASSEAREGVRMEHPSVSYELQQGEPHTLREESMEVPPGLARSSTFSHS